MGKSMVFNKKVMSIKIIYFVSQNFSYLFNQYNFVVIGEYKSDLNSDEVIILGCDGIRLKFTKDRGQFFLDIQSEYDLNEKWYTIDLMKYLINKEISLNSLLNQSNCNYIENNFEYILEFFKKEKIENTLSLLSEAKKIRGKKMFK